MVMAEYFTHDRLQELWHQIHHLHLTYLDTEDSPQKIEQRSKLEVCIREYLCIAPHNRKFYCPETAEVLHRSASSKKDFSGYRAVLAWSAVSMYAGNLLSQPWRKEYRQIKMYSGFYKHQIEANLVGAEAMFEAMGYKLAGDGVLVLEGPVCPDRVANVSQDSIVAFVECQILKTIWEEVSNNFKISWLDVLEFRQSHLCSPEQSIRMLNYRFHERRYQEHHGATLPHPSILSHSHSTPHPHSSHPPHHRSFPPPPDSDMYTPTPLRYSVPPTNTATPHLHYPPMTCTPQCAPQCGIYGPIAPGYYYGQVGVGGVRGMYGWNSMPACNPKPCNGYCYPNGCVQQFVCPTGQLIELDNAQNGQCYDTTDSAAKRQHDQLESHKQLAKSTNLDSLTLSKSKEDGAGTFESWDYVYRNLESQGYYRDLGERPDVLQNQDKKKHIREKKSKPSIELEDEINNLNLNETQIIKVKNKADDNRVAQSSSYDNLPSQENYNQPIKSISNGISKPSKTLPRERVLSPDKPNHITATLDSKKRKDLEKNKLKDTKLSKIKDESRENHRVNSRESREISRDLSREISRENPRESREISRDLSREISRENPRESREVSRDFSRENWNCNTCTYLNKSSVEICVMCGKSRKNVEHVLAVGGPQCPRCTLVNQKDANKCQACDTSLLNSPTYI